MPSSALIVFVYLCNNHFLPKLKEVIIKLLFLIWITFWPISNNESSSFTVIIGYKSVFLDFIVLVKFEITMQVILELSAPGNCCAIIISWHNLNRWIKYHWHFACNLDSFIWLFTENIDQGKCNKIS